MPWSQLRRSSPVSDTASLASASISDSRGSVMHLGAGRDRARLEPRQLARRGRAITSLPFSAAVRRATALAGEIGSIEELLAAWARTHTS